MEVVKKGNQSKLVFLSVITAINTVDGSTLEDNLITSHQNDKAIL